MTTPAPATPATAPPASASSPVDPRRTLPGLTEPAARALLEGGTAPRTLDAGQRAVVAALTAPLEPGRRGVYLHGGVGRGKTWITDTLARAAAPNHTRLHLHELLGTVNRLSVRHAGRLGDAVRTAVAGTGLLVLDEFVVHDVADALLLTRVLEALLPPAPDGAADPGPTVVIASNRAPEDLLDDPMHHHRMLPGIALLRAHLDVVPVADGEDYRGRAAAEPASPGQGGFASGTWRRVEPTEAGGGKPGARAGAGTGGSAADGAPEDDTEQGAVVEVHGRRVAVTAADEAAGVLTGTFAQLCGAPLSVQDHLALARRFGTWRLTDVPAPADADEQSLQRLAHLVDVLVDRDAALHVTAALDLTWFGRTVRASGLRDPERFLSRLSLLRAV